MERRDISNFYSLDVGFKNNHDAKKVAAVNNCVKSKADKYPSENEAIVRSHIPKTQHNTPNNQTPFLKLSKNSLDSVGCGLFMISYFVICFKAHRQKHPSS